MSESGKRDRDRGEVSPPVTTRVGVGQGHGGADHATLAASMALGLDEGEFEPWNRPAPQEPPPGAMPLFDVDEAAPAAPAAAPAGAYGGEGPQGFDAYNQAATGDVAQTLNTGSSAPMIHGGDEPEVEAYDPGFGVRATGDETATLDTGGTGFGPLVRRSHVPEETPALGATRGHNRFGGDNPEQTLVAGQQEGDEGCDSGVSSQGSVVWTLDYTRRATNTPSSARPTPTDAGSSPDTGPESRSSTTSEPSPEPTVRAFTTKSIDTFSEEERTINLLPHSPSLMSGGGETGNMMPRVLIEPPEEPVAWTHEERGSRPGPEAGTLKRPSHGANVPLVSGGSTPSAGGSPAKTSRWPESAGASSGGSGPACSSSSPESLTLFSPMGDGSSLRTFPDYCPPTVDEISPSFERRWPSSGFTTSPGESWTADTSECPSGGGASSSLRDVLEADVPPRFYLSPRGAAGILRRAARRDRQLPEALRTALERRAASTPPSTSTGASTTSSPPPSGPRGTPPEPPGPVSSSPGRQPPSPGGPAPAGSAPPGAGGRTTPTSSPTPSPPPGPTPPPGAGSGRTGPGPTGSPSPSTGGPSTTTSRTSRTGPSPPPRGGPTGDPSSTPATSEVTSFDPTRGGAWKGEPKTGETDPLRVGSGVGIPNPPAIQEAAMVRRLTPTECERLQGMPDGWTWIPPER